MLIVLVVIGGSLLFRVGPFTRNGILILYVGDVPEGLFTQQGTELYHWPKLAHEQRVTLSLSPGTYVSVAGKGACPPSLLLHITSGKTFDDVFMPIPPSLPGRSNAKCYPLLN